MINDYYIDPTDTNKLIEVCETFDQACQECVDNRNNPEYETTHAFGFSGEQLKQFAERNPNYDYQKHLPLHKDIISPFYSEVDRNERNMYKLQAKERARLARRYGEDWY